MNQPETVVNTDSVALSAAKDIWDIGNKLTGEKSQKMAQIQERVAAAIDEALSAKLGTMQERIDTLEALLYPPNPYEGNTITAVSSSSGEGATFSVEIIGDTTTVGGIHHAVQPSAVREPLSDDESLYLFGKWYSMNGLIPQPLSNSLTKEQYMYMAALKAWRAALDIKPAQGESGTVGGEG